MKSSTVFRSFKFRAAVGAGLIALSVAGCVGLELKERELVFRPVREAAGWFSGMPDTVQELYLPVGGDAQRMHAWWWPADDARAPIVYYLHGARWNLTGHLNRISQLRRFGFSVFAIDYRGFGKSEGDLPSEESVYEDARAGWEWVVRREPDAARRYIYGHSLGGAVAVELAGNSAAGAARGLIIESSFTSLAELATVLSNGWLPAGLLLSQKFDSIEKIRKLRLPVLIVHGGADRYVPARLSEALYAAAREPKKLLLIENGSHNNSIWVGDAAYRQALAELFGPLDAAPRDAAAATPAVASERADASVNRVAGTGVLAVGAAAQ